MSVKNRVKVNLDECNEYKNKRHDRVHNVAHFLMALLDICCVNILEFTSFVHIITGLSPWFFVFNLLVRSHDSHGPFQNRGYHVCEEEQFAIEL